MVHVAHAFEQIARDDPERPWELHRGQLREKPAMSYGHNHLARHLGYLLQQQLAWDEFQVSVNIGRLRHTPENYYIPDVFVIPTALTGAFRADPAQLEVYAAPLPLVVEVWSPSTGDYDVDDKLPAYQARGDLEIWRLHPFARTLTVWRRQPDGRYVESVHRSGLVQPAALPGVGIDLDVLFG